MASVTTNTIKPTDQQTLRRELLKLIVKREATRREQSRANDK